MSHDRQLKILILGINYSPELVGIAVYTAGLAEALKNRGHYVEVIAGKPYYPMWEVPLEYRGGLRRYGQENGVDVTRVAHYVPRKPSGLKRVAHHISFALSSLIPTLRAARRMRPDIVFTVAPSLIAAPVAKIAALSCGAKSWLHIQDFEVEAAMATGLIGKGNLVARWFEKWVLDLFERVSAISPAMCKKLDEKGISPDKIIEFRNWADIGAIKPLKDASQYRTNWKIAPPYIALYSGNIANKQGIEIVVDAARRLMHRRDLLFVICGQGPNRAKLQSQAGDLKNIMFSDLQPTERLGELLGLATVHLLPQLAGAADLVLPSKLTNMLASGRPVVATADSSTSLAKEVEGCGIVTRPGDDAAFATAIEQLIDDNETRNKLGNAARQRAEERWEKNAIINRLEGELVLLVSSCRTQYIPALSDNAG